MCVLVRVLLCFLPFSEITFKLFFSFVLVLRYTGDCLENYVSFLSHDQKVGRLVDQPGGSTVSVIVWGLDLKSVKPSSFSSIACELACNELVNANATVLLAAGCVIPCGFRLCLVIVLLFVSMCTFPQAGDPLLERKIKVLRPLQMEDLCWL